MARKVDMKSGYPYVALTPNQIKMVGAGRVVWVRRNGLKFRMGPKSAVMGKESKKTLRRQLIEARREIMELRKRAEARLRAPGRPARPKHSCPVNCGWTGLRPAMHMHCAHPEVLANRVANHVATSVGN